MIVGLAKTSAWQYDRNKYIYFARTMEIHKAAKKGRFEAVKRELESGVPVDYRDDEKLTALMYACMYRKKAICKLLLEHGASVKSRDKADWTPLMHAALGGDYRIIRMLLKERADVNARNDYGRTALIEAAYSANDKCIVELLAAGADINAVATRPQGSNPLNDAINQGNESTAVLLLNKGASIEIAEASRKQSILVDALIKGWNEFFLLALQKKANVNFKSYGDTPLMAALRFGNKDAAKALLEAGADPQQKNDQGSDIAEVVCFCSAEMFEMISKHLRLDKDMQAEIVKQTVWQGNRDLLECLLRRGWSLAPGALAWSCFKGVDFLGYMLENNSDPNMLDKNGLLPLNQAVVSRDEQVLKLLLDSGADPQRADGQKNTPLHISAKNGLFDISKLLLNYGANPSARNAAGITPLMLAAGSANGELVELLVANGAAVEERDCNGATALNWSAYNSSPNIAIVNFLLENGADPNSGPVNSRPLLHACSSGFYDERYSKPKSLAEDNLAPYIETLLNAGADPNIIATAWGIENLSALDLAKSTRCPEVVAMLIEHGAA